MLARSMIDIRPHPRIEVWRSADRYTAGVYLKTSPLFIVDGDTPEAAIEKAKAAGKQLADQLLSMNFEPGRN
jgi:hypothetical protein